MYRSTKSSNGPLRPIVTVTGIMGIVAGTLFWLGTGGLDRGDAGEGTRQLIVAANSACNPRVKVCE